MDTPAPATTPPKSPPRWQPVSAIDRRVLGVLVEKAKTTPDAYPMSVNAIATGANQKNNRHPIMQLEPEDVQESLDRLRHLGAVAEVQGGGRVPRFRHYAYDWLGVDKVEMAVMAELLLRGAQTEGELRGRAARMEPIADLPALRPVLQSLKAKKLVIPLTPDGRGHVVSHALYEPRELERIRSDATALNAAAMASSSAHAPAADGSAREVSSVAAHARPQPSLPGDALASLRSDIAELRREVEELRNELHTTQSELRELRDQLG